jgi:hypothetical protein
MAKKQHTTNRNTSWEFRMLDHDSIYFEMKNSVKKKTDEPPQ